MYGHVFKAPVYPAIFSCFIGAGVQIFMMFYLTLNSFVFFFTTNSLRPPIFYIIMSVLAGMGFLNGLVTMRTLKFFGLTDWIFSAMIASISLPTFVYFCIGAEVILMALAGGYQESVLWHQLIMTVLWCITNFCTCFLGSYKGYMMPRVEAQATISKFNRPIAEQPKWMNLILIMIFFGGIQYASVCIEFSAIVNSMWRAQLYFFFGFLLADVILLLVVIGLLAVIQTYI